MGGVRRCLKYDTKVQMSDGTWKDICNIVIGDQVNLPDGTSALVNQVIDNGEREIVKIHLKDGTFFECSSEHRWFVFNHTTNECEWVATKDLKGGKFSMLSPD